MRTKPIATHNDAMSTVLVVDDEPIVRDVVVRYLRRDGFATLEAATGEEAMRLLEREVPSLVVLDVMLPGTDGLEICRRIRATSDLPIVLLTARGDEADRIVGLELGADDYVAKPFSPRELTARVKAVLRRATGPLSAAGRPAVLRAGELEVDVTAHEARLAGELVALTAKEFDLLAHLMEHPRRAFRREELLDRVWGFSYGDTSTVTVHIRRLREKIESDPSVPRYVTTVWGVGYRFEP
jgi:DNA-binding response OmpR family regulator